MSVLRAIAWPFWSAEERRLRAVWRLAIYVVLVGLAMFASGRLTRLSGDPLTVLAFFYGVQTLAVLGVTWLAARFVDRRWFGDLGLRPRRGYAIDLAFGVLAGGMCMAVIAIVEDSCGWAVYATRVRGIDALLEIAPSVGAAFTTFIGVALIEEITFRAYAITNIAEGLAPQRSARPAKARTRAVLAALVISSVLFGLAHAQNPSADEASVAYIAFGGVFLAVGYILQGDLALPIGLHLGWNFFQALLGMPVSGQGEFDGARLVLRSETGPDLITGGPFGPEAGLTGLCAMAIGIALSIGWVRARTGRARIVARLGASPRGPISTVPVVSPGA